MVVPATIIVLLLLAIPAIPVGIGLGYAWVKCAPLRAANAADTRPGAHAF